MRARTTWTLLTRSRSSSHRRISSSKRTQTHTNPHNRKRAKKKHSHLYIHIRRRCMLAMQTTNQPKINASQRLLAWCSINIYSLKSKQCSRSLKTKFKIPRCVYMRRFFVFAMKRAAYYTKRSNPFWMCVCVCVKGWFLIQLNFAAAHAAPLKNRFDNEFYCARIPVTCRTSSRAFLNNISQFLNSCTIWRSCARKLSWRYTLQMRSTTHRSAHTQKKVLNYFVFIVFFFLLNPFIVLKIYNLLRKLLK